MSPARRSFNLAPTPDTTGRGDDHHGIPPCAEVDPGLFHVPGDSKAWERPEHAEQLAIVRGICGPCPLRSGCLAGALEQGDKHAFRGNTTPAERERLVRKAKRRAVVDEAPHGTPAAYRRHYRRKETPCEACSKAAARDRKDRYWREREEAS